MSTFFFGLAASFGSPQVGLRRGLDAHIESVRRNDLVGSIKGVQQKLHVQFVHLGEELPHCILVLGLVQKQEAHAAVCDVG